MGLAGLDIFKLLPKTNCKKCGFATCLAFAMALANKKTTVDLCPDISAEAKETLSAAAEPPMRLVTIGSGDNKVEIGDETELFRHDKRFNHPVAIAVIVNDNEDIDMKIENINRLAFERAGQQFEVDMIALVNASGDRDVFRAAAEKTAAATEKSFVLVSPDPLATGEALQSQSMAGRRPLLYAAESHNYIEMAKLALERDLPLAVKADGLDALADLVTKITALGCRELVLDAAAEGDSGALLHLTQIRRLALRKKFRPFGFPALIFTTKSEPREEMLQIVTAIAKYAGIIVVKMEQAAHVFPLLSLRENIYADPQKPVAVQPGLYPVGDADEHAPVYCTTNFSLTYFLVAGEVEATRIPSYILSVDTSGTSVLTAYADNKFTAEKITEAMRGCNLEEKVKHRDIIIPGAVAVIQGSLEKESGWNVLVGPYEASGIGKFAKSRFT